MNDMKQMKKALIILFLFSGCGEALKQEDPAPVILDHIAGKIYQNEHISTKYWYETPYHSYSIWRFTNDGLAYRISASYVVQEGWLQHQIEQFEYVQLSEGHYRAGDYQIFFNDNVITVKSLEHSEVGKLPWL